MKSNPPNTPIHGFSSNETVMMDLDEMTYHKTVKLAEYITKHFKLDGYRVLRSSKGNYHIVFDRPVSLVENFSILGWTDLILFHCKNPHFHKWVDMQMIKKCPTLRVGSKRDKLPPRTIFKKGSQDHEIAQYLKTRAMVKRLEKKMEEVKE